jgi:hypothetical protein
LAFGMNFQTGASIRGASGAGVSAAAENVATLAKAIERTTPSSLIF